MTEFLLDYASFFAKAITVVIAFGLIALIVVSAASRRGRDGGSTNLEVKHLNERYDAMRQALQSVVLPKAERKRLAKARKKEQKKLDKAPAPQDRRKIFVIDFEGDLRATGIDSLREEVTAVLTLAEPADEVVVRLENAGGVVHGHGLAASQLARIRERGIALSVIVDKVAASGGYMMACVANKIISAPFAIIGSIGVLAQLPNFHRLLERYGVDFEQVMAGEYKRTVTLFGENTDADRRKLQADLEEIHTQFKAFITKYRPELDVERVATGEHWHGEQALALGLIDELMTSDDYLMHAAEDADLYRVRYAVKSGLTDRLSSMFASAVGRTVDELSKRYQSGG
ncbi:MAG: protease SohB [Pseudomonadota bacterium]